MRNEEVGLLHTIRDIGRTLGTIKRKNANWIAHILRKNCLLKHVIEGKIERRLEVTGRRGRGLGQLLDILKKKRGYCKLKEVATNSIL